MTTSRGISSGAPRVAYNPAKLLRRTSRLQFSLRTLMLMAVIAAICASMVRRAREQQAAVRLIRAYGGSVAYDFQERPAGSGLFDRDACPDMPASLVEALGEDMLGDIILAEIDRDTSGQASRSLQSTSLDSVALRLTAFTKLRYLFFWGNVKPSDQTLEVIGGLANLEAVAIVDARAVTNGGISHLARLQKLSVVAIDGASITDESLQTLARCHSLRDIYLTRCRITDRGISHLRGMHALKRLRLSGTEVEMGQEAVSSLGTLQSLEELDLSSARVTSRAFQCLAPLPNLRVLNLSNNASFTDDGMVAVGRLTNLEELRIDGTGVTADGMQSLWRLKKLRIVEKCRSAL